jgi:putative transposase
VSRLADSQRDQDNGRPDAGSINVTRNEENALPYRSVPLIAGEYYHVYNRGHNHELIFFEEENYAFFLRRWRTYVAPANAVVVCYVLMPNHYHFVLKAQSNELSEAMHSFGMSYAKAINARFHRTGSLFDSRFQAKLIERDEYLLHLSRYIHLNPVRAGLAVHAEEWPYSSYPDYVGLRQGTLARPDIVLGQIGGPEQYRCLVEEYRAGDRAKVAPWLVS